MYRVLQPASLGGLELRNRFMRSATWDATADETGAVTDLSVKLYEDLAAGGVGLIVTGFAFVSDLGRTNPGHYGIHCDEMIPGISRLVQAAHEHGAKIAIQIAHAGGVSPYLAQRGKTALAPSQIEGQQPQRALTGEEIEGIIDDFAAAAVRAREAGFDAVQLHGAHRYLMAQFLSPITNHRQDRWGGTPEDRRRFHVETVRRVRAAVGPDFPLMIKFGVMDDIDGGTLFEEGVATAKAMVEAGIDMLEVSAGISGGNVSSSRVLPPGVTELAYYRERTARAKKELDIPVAVVGGIRSLEMAEDIVKSGDADLIALCRPLIREPSLIRRWLEGDRRPAICISCAKCMALCRRGEPLECGEELRLRTR